MIKTENNWGAGLGVELKSAINVGISTGLSFTQYNAFVTDEIIDINYNYKVLSLPIMLFYEADTKTRFRPNIGLGTAINYVISNNNSNTGQNSSLYTNSAHQPGFLFRIGLNYYINDKSFIQANYNYEKLTIGNPDPPVSFSSQIHYFSVGYYFKLSK